MLKQRMKTSREKSEGENNQTNKEKTIENNKKEKKIDLTSK